MKDDKLGNGRVKLYLIGTGTGCLIGQIHIDTFGFWVALAIVIAISFVSVKWFWASALKHEENVISSKWEKGRVEGDEFRG